MRASFLFSRFPARAALLAIGFASLTTMAYAQSAPSKTAAADAPIVHSGASAGASAEAPPRNDPPPTPSPNIVAINHARVAFCTNLTELYSTVIGMPFTASKAELAINGTVQRHETLSRLLIMAWAQNCDFSPLFTMERDKITNLLNAPPPQRN